MAISPEQLDIRKLAKLFLLKSEIGKVLTVEDLKKVLEMFTENDWDNIRDNISPSSDEKKALREVIENCKQFLKNNENNTGNNEGNYPLESYQVLEQSVSIAAAIARSTYDGNGDEGTEGRKILKEAKEALLNAKERVVESIITEVGVELTVNGELRWYSPNKYYGVGKWFPIKKILANTESGSSVPYYVSLTPVPRKPDGGAISGLPNLDNYIRGLYLKDSSGEYIITRQTTVGSGNAKKAIKNLGGAFDNITIIDGAIINFGESADDTGCLIDDYGMESIMYCSDEDVRFAALASSYLGRVVNPAPCVFFANGEGMRYDVEYDTMFRNIIKSTNVLHDKAKAILHIISPSSTSNFKEIQSASGNVSLSLTTLTALPKMSDGRTILVDNVNKVITGIGVATASTIELIRPENSSSIVFGPSGCKSSLKTITEGSKIVAAELTITSADKSKTVTYYVNTNTFLVDQTADSVGEYYISKYPAYRKDKKWIPAVLLGGKYYISPEPINSELRLYKGNKEIIQIVGILDESQKTLFSRQDITRLYPELIQRTGIYRLTHVDLGYYNGYIFSSSNKHQAKLNNYLKYLPVFSDGILRGQSTGNSNLPNDIALGFVKSTFKQLSVNGEVSGDYYLECSEADLTRIPNTRSECKTYLNIVAYKSLPSGK